MTKSELVSSVADSIGKTKKDTEEIVNVIIKTITSTLAKGESVNIVGFGQFEVRKRAAREGVNPRTHEKMHIGESITPAFKAGKQLKEAVSVLNKPKPRGRGKNRN